MFTLELRLAGGELTSTLHNAGKTAQRYFHHTLIQPVTLTIVDSAGRSLPPRDKREIAKFDATPYKHLYQVLEPGASVRLLTANVRQGVLHWGPFSWAELAPGRYTVTAHLDHQMENWVDRETKQTGTWTDLWRGQLHSKPVSLNF